MTPDPGSPSRAPATGSTDPADTDLSPEEEPSTPGTLFLNIILLMIIGGFWIVIYRQLLAR